MAMTPLARLDAAVRRIDEYVGDRVRRGVAHDDADDSTSSASSSVRRLPTKAA
jgi:hypothetical protein